MIEYENMEVVKEFLDETLSGFDTIENIMIQLEKAPDNIDLINAIFRPIHSLKGNSAYFGLFKVKKLTHNLENLLDFSRKGDIKITPEIISVLLSNVDYLREMIERVENEEEEVIDEEEYESKLQQINQILSKQEEQYSISLMEKNKIIEFINQMNDDCDDKLKDKATDILSFFKVEKEQSENVNEIQEIIELENMFSNPFESGEASDEEVEKIKELMTFVNSFCQTEESKDAYAKLLDTYNTFVDSGLGIDEIAQEILSENLNSLKHLITVDVPSEDKLNNQNEPQKEKDDKTELTKKSSPRKSEESTIRINEKSLDEFLNYVADLLSIEELFGYIGRELSAYSVNLASNFKRNMDDFARISSRLRNGIMDIRKIGAANLLNKVNRIIRDISQKSGKEIEVVISGENLKIDKNYIELLDSPLVHMVRNAADHGIETKEERIQLGKNEIGKIEINLFENEKSLVLEIKDDGKGLDLDQLKIKAIEKGIIKKNQSLKETDIINLLFQSGVSTAKEITDVSGRGVGMDVVKRAIESAEGVINVETKNGIGSTFSIELPKSVSTKINDVYLVKSFSDEEYALPLKLIEEAFTIDYEEIYSIKNSGNVLKRRGNLLSVFVMDNILEEKNVSIEKYFKEHTNVPFVYVNFPGHPLAICIKEVVGVQTIVVKNISNLKFNAKIFEGAATLGDGKIALVINQDWLLNYITQHS